MVEGVRALHSPISLTPVQIRPRRVKFYFGQAREMNRDLPILFIVGLVGPAEQTPSPLRMNRVNNN